MLLWVGVCLINKISYPDNFENYTEDSLSNNHDQPLTGWNFLDGVKPVDLCILSYHHGAQSPSIGLGPASHLKNVLTKHIVIAKRPT